MAVEYLGIKMDIGIAPELDPDFIPLEKFNRAFLASAKKPLGIAVERAGEEMAVYETRVYGTAEMQQADVYYVDRLVKFLLWMKGGFRIYIRGDRAVYEALRERYSASGARAFDVDFMTKVFERPFEVRYVDVLPAPRDAAKSVGGHFSGCRIGFDAGGSDRKVSAVVDGQTVYAEEVVWYPKLQSDPKYHYDGIVAALRSAAAHMPRVDAVGVSTAGVIIHDRVMQASLFLQVPPEKYNEVKDIYLRAVRDTFGNVPVSVVNDGDVSALAGAVSMDCSNVLGIAMGTSEAVGFVDDKGKITGWLNELAFCPVDAAPDAMRDEWSGDIGCGVKYFSQDGVIKLAPRAGIELDDSLSPAQKLKLVQQKMEAGDPAAAAVYRSIGVYLAHSLALYWSFYRFRHVLLLGRVMSGKGGDTLLQTCRETIASVYPELVDKIHLALPDEKFRRVGQSAIAASLPEITAD